MLNQAQNITSYLPMALTTLIWGSMGVPASYAIAEIPPMALLAIRSLVAVLLLLPCVWLTERKLTPPREDLPTVILMGLTGVFGNNVFYFQALTHTSLMNISIIFATTPLITAILARILLGEPLGPRRILGIAAAFSGAVLLLTQGQPHLIFQIQLNQGDIAEFGAAFMASLLAILGRRVRSASSSMATLYCMISGTAAAIAAMPLLGQNFPVPSSLSSKALYSALYLGAFGSALAYMTQQVSVKKIGASASAAFLNASPVIGLLAAWLFMDEKISLIQILSGAVIFCGVFLNAQAKKNA